MLQSTNLSEMKSNLFLLIFLFNSCFLVSQDLHFSQFYNSPLNINPGSTGVFNGAQRLHAGYRTQWNNVVPWNTFTAAYDRKFIHKKCTDPKSYFSGGIVLNHDRVSDLSKLTLTNVNITGSYTLRIDSSNLITFGGLLGLAGRAFDENQLIWDKQWINNAFNLDADSGEGNISNRITFIETALGVNYRWQKHARTKLDLGIGVFHLAQPNVAFHSNNIGLFRRYSLSAVGQFQLSQRLDIQLNGLAQWQGPYSEYVIGGLGKLYVNQNPGRHVEVHLGLGYRTSGSLFPILAVQYNRIYASVSYDIDMSDINELKGVRPNTLELHFRYIIANPIWGKKGCPIY